MPMLPVPEVPQWGDGANYRRNDCGVACVAMLLAYYGKLGRLTVDQLAAETGLRLSDSGLMPLQLAVVAAKHGLPLKVHPVTSLDDLRAEIDAGRPSILLVAYRYILGRLDQADNVPGSDGHYLVCLGYDDSHFVINDPDTWVPISRYGLNDLIPVTELEKALFYGQCLFVGDVTMTKAEQLKALAAQIAAVADSLPEEKAPDPTPLPTPVYKYATVNDLNIRGGRGTNYPILQKLKLGARVRAVATMGEWDQIDEPIAGNVYNSSLSTTAPKP